jgi:hypothetical protein
MVNAVYFFCALTSLCCALLLMRGYRTSRHRLLLWGSLCFFVLFLANVFLVADLVIFPEVDLQPYRAGLTLIGMCLLLYGMIFESDT